MTAADVPASMDRPEVRRTFRYRGLLAPVIFLAAVGLAFGSQVLILAGIVPLAFLVFDAMATGQAIDERVRVTRELEPTVAIPGQPVQVTLEVENTTESVIADLRALDGVPTELGVSDGQARGGKALGPGDCLTLTYSLIADRGTYEFEDVILESYNATGTVVSRAGIKAAGDASFDCRVAADQVPLQQETTAFAGPLATDTGGSGIEFFATREYRPGDPVKRIHWRRYAKTGELSTIEYREQRATRVAIIIDGRQPARRSADAVLPTGTTLAAYAATIAVGVLLQEGHRVSLGALGVPDPIRGEAPAWATGQSDRAFKRRVADICNAAASGSEAATGRAAQLQADGGTVSTTEEWHWIDSRLSAGSQVLFCTPALDDPVTDIAETFLASGHPVTVLSPDVTASPVGGRILALERGNRLDGLRSGGARLVDWDPSEPLPIAMERTLRTAGL